MSLRQSVEPVISYSRARAVYLFVLVLAIVWVSCAVLAPLLGPAETRRLILRTEIPRLASLLYYFYGAVCHQIPDRCFQIGGSPMAACARCFGSYVGATLGLLIYPHVRSITSTHIPERRWLLIGLALLAVDFTGGAVGLFSNTLISRSGTGFVVGLIAVFYVLPGLISASSALVINPPRWVVRVMNQIRFVSPNSFARRE